MKPKPPPETYGRALRRVLGAALAGARPAAADLLLERPDILTLVPWTHRFYGQDRDIARDLGGLERLLRNPQPSPADIREIESMARRLRRLWRVLGDALPFLGRVLARPELRLTISEVHRYLQDQDGVGSEVRAMLKAPLRRAWQAGERILLIGHSLGSVIAYDALWELSHEERNDGRISLFVTLGSPLATRVVRRHLHGVRERGVRRYPLNIGRWINFSARGETAALRASLRPFFRQMLTLGLTESIEDHAGLYNHFRGDIGLNVHDAYGYLVNPLVAGAIAAWLTDD